MLNKKEALSYIVRRRAVFNRHARIAEALAARYNIDYNYAKKFVFYVEANYARRIAGAQLFVVLLLGGVICLSTGSALWLWFVQPFIDGARPTGGFVPHYRVQNQLRYIFLVGILFFGSVVGILRALVRFVLAR